MTSINPNDPANNPKLFRVKTPYSPIYLSMVVDAAGQRFLPLMGVAEILGVNFHEYLLPMTETKFWGRQTVGGRVSIPITESNTLFCKIKNAWINPTRRQFLDWCRVNAREELLNFRLPEPVVPLLVEEPEVVPIPAVQTAVLPVVAAAPQETGLRTFSFGAAPIRVVMKDDQPWWMAKDVCSVLEIGNVGDALSRLDPDEKDDIDSIDAAGRPNHAAIVSESGLYSLVLGSRKPEAKAFKRWITHEVIPSIRKTGSYGVQQFHVPQSLREALLLAADQQATIEAHQATIAILEPKAQFTDRVSNTQDLISIREFAKILGTGQNRYYQWLRTHGYMIPGTTEPYQRWVDLGIFVMIEKAFEDAHGLDRVGRKPMITGKGQIRLQQEWDRDRRGGEAS